jgi:hypothetical protein
MSIVTASVKALVSGVNRLGPNTFARMVELGAKGDSQNARAA